jgi:hypothetical protein
MSEDDLKKVVKAYFDKWFNLEGEMFFLQREVILRDLQVIAYVHDFVIR